MQAISTVAQDLTLKGPYNQLGVYCSEATVLKVLIILSLNVYFVSEV